MISNRYKKTAGTCAVFVLQETQEQSPVDREGLVWASAELHVVDLPLDRKIKPGMPNTLSLEGWKNTTSLKMVISGLSNRWGTANSFTLRKHIAGYKSGRKLRLF